MTATAAAAISAAAPAAGMPAAPGGAPVLSLDPRYYTDAAVYRREQDGGMARAWQFAGHASQLQKAGDYFTFEMAGERMFCMMGDDGVSRAFYNVCQHRAHLTRNASACSRRRWKIFAAFCL